MNIVRFVSFMSGAVSAPNRVGLVSVPLWIGMAFLGSLFLALTSYTSIPTPWVPVTLQTCAIALVGSFYGWRLGMATVLVWLAEGAAGFPVLANGAGGIGHFFGPTGGYLFFFPFIAWVAGRFVPIRGGAPVRFVVCTCVVWLGLVLHLVVGAVWLSMFLGVESAFYVGLISFLPLSLVKACFVSAVLCLASRGVNGGWQAMIPGMRRED